MRTRLMAAALAAGVFAGTLPAADSANVTAALAAIKAVGREGAGNEEAAAGWKQLVAAGQPALLPTLAAFGDASPTAANWLRSAVDAIAEGEKRAGREIDVESLRAFVRETKNDPAARRIAYELYAKLDERAGRMLPKMIHDPSLDIRRDAIAARVALVKLAAGGANGDLAKIEWKVLLDAARDLDQIEEMAAAYEKAGGEKTDLTTHLNFITKWHVVGPFDGRGGKAFTTPDAPEKGVDLKATYAGKGGVTVAWKPAEAKTVVEDKERTLALVDLNAALGKHKDAVGYAYAEVIAEKETPIDLRAASQNAIVMFVNGAKVFDREEYHHGTTMDQHVGKATLKPGTNRILLKLIQNDQKEEWAQVWGFQCRVSDHLGGPVAGVKPAK